MPVLTIRPTLPSMPTAVFNPILKHKTRQEAMDRDKVGIRVLQANSHPTMDLQDLSKACTINKARRVGIMTTGVLVQAPEAVARR